MALKIEEKFEVQAPIERVWSFLIDPERVVVCLPGAELTEVKGDRTFAGRIRVKVGPVTASYQGEARMEEVDEATRTVRLAGEGRDTAGAGSAKMTMTSRLEALPEGGTRVEVEAEVDVAGRIVQFGRGLLDGVSRQLFRQFVTCAQSQLEQEEAPAPAPQPPGIPAGSETGAPARPPAPRVQLRPREAEPVKALPLLFRAIVQQIRGLLARLTGR